MAKKNLAAVQLKNPDWKLHRPPLPSFEEYAKTIEPRDWQALGIEKLRHERFAGLVAPCGAGKTSFQIMMSLLDIVDSNFTQAQLIHVPQLHIGWGFVRMREFQVEKDGPPYEHVVGDSENFVRSFSSFEAKVRSLEQWLTSSTLSKRGAVKDPDSFRGLIAVCSNALLIAVFDGLERRAREGSEKSRKAARQALTKLIQNTTFRPDEMHHIRGGSDNSQEESNGLGRFYSYLMGSRVTSSKVCYSTATPFRGDCQEIFSRSVWDKFVVYEHSWLENWRTLGIRSFDMEYTEFDRDPKNLILAAVAAEPKCQHLVAVPRMGEAWRKGTKGEKILRSLIKELKALGNVCDLVVRDEFSEAERNKNKKLLLQDNEDVQEGKKPVFNIVIACDIVREGTDWVICDRIHEAAPKKSITNNIQTMGRMFRRFHRKTVVKYVAYIPKFIIPKGCSSRAELLGDRTRILLFFMIVDDLAYPCMLPSMKTKADPGNSDPDARTIEDVYTPEVYQKLLGKVLEEFRCAAKPEGMKDMDHVRLFIDKLLVQYNTPEEHMEHARNYFTLKLLNMFGAKKIRVASYKELAEYLKKYGEVLFERIDVDKTTHYGNFSEKELKEFYEICSDWRDAFWAQKQLRPL